MFNESQILVPEDGGKLVVYAKLPPEEFEFTICYKLLSKNFNHQGKINCKVMPSIDVRSISREADEGEETGYCETIVAKTFLDEK